MKYLILILILFLAGCQNATVKIVPVVQTSPPLYCGIPPATPPLKLLPVLPKAITDSTGVVWVGLIPKHYENLGINTEAQLFTLIVKNEIIIFYKRCIDAYNRALEASKPTIEE